MMKWWGWGDPNIEFPMAEKPLLWPWIAQKLGLKEVPWTPPVDRKAIQLPASRLASQIRADLLAVLRPDQVLDDEDERWVHCFGKSYPDLWRARRGEAVGVPDAVLLPEGHGEVERIVAIAHRHDVCIVPFGGGTNIVGGVGPTDPRGRAVLSLDLRRMNRLLTVDPESRTAVIEAGALGPKLEADLGGFGFALGHCPDSFEYSTLGGWLATRSAGMQSDEYGKIEHMVVSLKVVTPAGTLETKTVPASSAGPDLNHWIVGSEGIFGVITEATVRVHRVPEVKDYRGFLFRDFETAVDAIQECIESKAIPSMIRLQDRGETELAFHMKAPKQGLAGWVHAAIKAHLVRKGYGAPCIMVVGFEGPAESIQAARSRALRILKRNGAFALGPSVGKSWSKDKYNVPYLRDYVMDRGCMADVAETAATWSNVLPLYRETVRVMRDRFERLEGGHGYLGCHISHTYKTGACLYFTYATQRPVQNQLEHYYGYKNAITEAFLRVGGALSHHHAVGVEHRPWIGRELTETGLGAVQALKAALDPKGIMNPGKLVPDASERRAKGLDEGIAVFPLAANARPEGAVRGGRREEGEHLPLPVPGLEAPPPSLSGSAREPGAFPVASRRSPGPDVRRL